MNSKFSRGQPRTGQWVLHAGHTRPGIAVAVDAREDGLYVRVEFVNTSGFAGDLIWVKNSELVPLLDKEQIPSRRLVTMDPKWTPKA